MYHPLLGNPADLKDAELDAKILDLSRKYHIAAGMGQGGPASQIVIALEMYKDEQYRRQMEASRNLGKKDNDDLGNLINVE